MGTTDTPEPDRSADDAPEPVRSEGTQAAEGERDSSHDSATATVAADPDESEADLIYCIAPAAPEPGWSGEFQSAAAHEPAPSESTPVELQASAAETEADVTPSLVEPDQPGESAHECAGALEPVPTVAENEDAVDDAAAIGPETVHSPAGPEESLPAEPEELPPEPAAHVAEYAGATEPDPSLQPEPQRPVEELELSQAIADDGTGEEPQPVAAAAATTRVDEASAEPAQVPEAWWVVELRQRRETEPVEEPAPQPAHAQAHSVSQQQAQPQGVPAPQYDPAEAAASAPALAFQAASRGVTAAAPAIATRWDRERMRDIGVRAAKVAGIVFAAWFTTVLFLILVYRFVNPPFSSLMALQWLAGTRIEQSWVPLSRISPNLRRAVIVSEDGRFCSHWGIDFAEVAAALRRTSRGVPRGASTITMQVAKNLFLWPAKSYLRKLIEVPLTYAIELAWPKWRILEVYLNIAEWGPGIFGAEAAARAHFGASAAALGPRQAAQLAVSLPNPILRDAGSPGPRATRRASVIQRRAVAMRSASSCVDPVR